MLVAADAGVGRPAAGVLAEEVRHDQPLQVLLEAQHVVADAEDLGDAARIGDAVGAAAGGPAGRRLRQAEAHRYADDLETLVLQQGGGDGGIDASAHRHSDAPPRRFVHIHRHPLILGPPYMGLRPTTRR